MSTELAHREPDTIQLSEHFARSGFFQDSREVSQAVVKILAGRELNFPPVASMTGIHIIKGKVSISAGMMAALIKKSGRYNYRIIKHDDAICQIEFTEDKRVVGVSEFTIEDAKAGGILSDQYRKFPRNMLFARAMSNGAKWYCADIFGGSVYVEGELDEDLPASGTQTTVKARPVSPLQAQIEQAAQPQLPAPEQATPETEPKVDPLEDIASFTAMLNKSLARAGFSTEDALKDAYERIWKRYDVKTMAALPTDKRESLLNVIAEGKLKPRKPVHA